MTADVPQPYYDHAGIKIFHADCREVFPLLEPMEIIVSDPPYGISHSSNHGASWNGKRIPNDHDTSLRDWLVDRIDGRPAAIFGTWKVSPPQGVIACLVWDKGPAFGMGDLSVPWKGSWELIWIFGQGWHGSRDEGVLRGHLVVSWETRGRRHPHEKPVSLIAALLNKAPEGAVLDPFCGSGTTLLAAKNMGRKAIGIELDEKYCEIAARRCDQEVFEFSDV